METERVTASTTIDATPEMVFAVLADPSTHSAIDGTGWVQEVVDRSPLAEVGQIFRMGMYHADHPDGNYQAVNQVQVFDAPRAIAWLTGQELGDGQLEFGGWVWRYDLALLGPCETEVTLTYDWSAVPQFIRERGIQFPPFGPEHLTNSLRHLSDLVTPETRRPNCRSVLGLPSNALVRPRHRGHHELMRLAHVGLLAVGSLAYGCSSGNIARVADACDLLTSGEVAKVVQADAQPGVLRSAIGESEMRLCSFKVSGQLGAVVVYLGEGDAPANTDPNRAIEVRGDTYVIVSAQNLDKGFPEEAANLAGIAIGRAARQ